MKQRWPVTLTCGGTPAMPHEPVSWLGSWESGDENTTYPPCWMCGERGRSTPPRYPYMRHVHGD